MNETFKLNDQQIAGFKSCGNTIADSETDLAGAAKTFVGLVTVTLKGSWVAGNFVESEDGKPTKVADYNLWVAGSEQVKQGYADTKGLTNLDNDSVKSMFKRFTRNVSDLYGISKPAKPTESGKAKAEQRSKALIAKQELAKRDIDDLQAEIIELSAKPSKENVKLTSKLLDAVAYKQKAENKDFDSDMKLLKKIIKEQVTKCEDMPLLQDISNMLD
jgi:hypothetical protein